MGLEILKFDVLRELVNRVPPAQGLVWPRFFPARDYDGDSARWDIVYGNRTIGKYKATDAPSKGVGLMGAETKRSEFAHIALHKVLPESVLLYERQPGTIDQPALEAKITQEAADLAAMIDRQTEWAAWQALITGGLVVNQPDVKFTVDYGVPADHLNVAPTKLWSDPTANIPADIMAWKKKYAEDTLEPPTQLWMGTAIMNYLIQNQAIRDLLGPQRDMQMAMTGRLNRLLDLELIVYDGAYVDDAGSVQHFLPEDKVLLCASPGTWAELQRGSALVPVEGRDDQMQKVIGRWAYSRVTKDPVAKILVAGENHLPCLLKPDYVFVADVA